MTTEMRLDKHAYRGPPRRVGSSWSAVEANPPDKHAWRDHNARRYWNWKPKGKRKGTAKPQKSQHQQALDLLAKLLCGNKRA